MGDNSMMIEGVDIQRVANSCFRIKASGLVIYIDPIQVSGSEKADLILLTHDHPDHLSLKDIDKLMKDETVVVCSPVTHQPLLQLDRDINNLFVIGRGEIIREKAFEVETVHAYNVDKFASPGRPYHPKEDEGFGFILTIAGKRIYHAGDTDFIPEMRSFKEIDIALLPVSGETVMTAEEAVMAAETIGCRIAIPMHWGFKEGSEEDAARFVEGFFGGVMA